MVHHVLNRKDLYERVWQEPMRTVAQSLGVSDVGLAKACRSAGIPTPPRGYWAKLKHDKPLPPRPPLPKRSGQSDAVVIAPPGPKPPPSPAAQAAMDALETAASVSVPDDLRSAHPIVRGWITKNAERRREHKRNGWGLYGIEDLSTPLAQRRLRLTSALLKALQGRGLTLGEERDHLTAGRGEDHIAFRLYERSKVEHRPATADELRWEPGRKTVRATVPAGDLVLKIRDYVSVPTEFKELKTPLDAQLPAVIASLEAGLTELAERRRQRALQAELYARAEAERRKREAYHKAEAALVERLMEQAQRRQKADAVRAYVQAADNSPASQDADYAAWRAWALEEADAIDPVLDGSAPFARLPAREDWEWRGW